MVMNKMVIGTDGLELNGKIRNTRSDKVRDDIGMATYFLTTD